MYIKELTTKFYKSIGSNLETLTFGIPNGNIGSGLNIFIGENNTGKSTIFEAFDFLRNKPSKPKSSIVNKSNPDKDAIVDIVFKGDIDSVIEEFSQDNKKSVFRARVYEIDGAEHLKLQRSTEGKSPIKIWNSETGIYDNVSGIDAPVKGMFEANFVWADTNPNDEAKFGSSTITGNLIGEILNSFTEHEEYQTFLEQYDTTFNNEASNLKQQLSDIEQRTQNIFQEQFGAGNIQFQFEPIAPSNFFKNVKVYIDDGTETVMDEKGSGMQRAVALAMVQVYADILRQQPDTDLRKPLFLFIDEPEICLHPKAQDKLFNALLELSRSNQIFIATHSPYFLSSEHVRDMNLFVCKQGEDGPEISNISSSGFFPWSPTWGEINYMAFDMPTVELHNELYGRLQEVTENWTLKDFDDYLESQGIPKDKSWTEEKKGVIGSTFDRTLMTFIRNKIHHPENTTMLGSDYTSEELKNSIDSMIAILNTIDD
ncbi:AAA family ATPase [uncultured Draconibacterium sp.]|uniref:ATP-dependent nuclease n=1 Tax=uncultured Draconibacterium sp. TaxID=1573823 RepID=UPI0029C60B86|nr:AAA family ATPase [uncultured Draconibacterium sp.]